MMRRQDVQPGCEPTLYPSARESRLGCRLLLIPGLGHYRYSSRSQISSSVTRTAQAGQNGPRDRQPPPWLLPP